MNVVDIYTWLSSNPDNASKLYAAIGKSDMLAVVDAVQKLGVSSMDEALKLLSKPNAYHFKRRFYYRLKNTFQQHTITFLTGPRKCGKTVSLLQLAEEVPNCKYVNVEPMSESEQQDILLEIEEALRNNLCINYLIDEFTYFSVPDTLLGAWAVLLGKYKNTNTHIVITGSQGYTLRCLSSEYFCGTCGNVTVNFLTYSEWLDYKSLQPCEDSYTDYLINVDTFYGFASVKKYLEGCLHETVISNSKVATNNCVFDLKGVTVDLLLDVLTASLVHLHDTVSYRTFIDETALERKALTMYRKDFKATQGSLDRLKEFIEGRYAAFKGISSTELYNAIMALYAWKLITITPISDSLQKLNVPLLMKPNTKSGYSYGEEVFSTMNICIRNPVFFMVFLKHVFDNFDIHGSLLGSIVECHIRGLLREDGALEYRPFKGKEIDYVNVAEQVAIEITINAQHRNNFDLLPDGYKTLMLSKNSYCEFIASLESSNFDNDDYEW